MKEREKRLMQLEELKDGLWAGEYIVRVKSFDGQTIEEYRYAHKEIVDEAFEYLKAKYNKTASVSKRIEFVI